MPVTIHDVAQKAGVGVGTVSRVLNKSESVRESTREKVLEVISALHYHPDPIARSLTLKRTGSVGVIIPFFTRPFQMEILRGVSSAATRQGLELVIYNVETQEQRDEYFSRLARRRRVDGLLVISLSPEDEVSSLLKHAGLPAIFVDAYSPFFSSIVVKNMEGAFNAVRSLTAQGHRRIGFINGVIEGNFKFNQANDRLIGYHQALWKEGLSFEPELVLNTSWDIEGGFQAALKFLNLVERPTAIFAASDMQAIGILKAAKKMGLEVPRDLSVMGFDGVEASEYLEISTMQQPMQEMGELGLNKLAERLKTPGGALELIRLDTFPVIRCTTGPVPKTVG